MKKRPLNYFHDLITRDKKEMLFNFVRVQWHNPTKGDWTEQIKQDLKDLEMEPNFSYYSSMKTENFKEFVKHQSKENSLKELNMKKESHSKVKTIIYSDVKMQPYLMDKGLDNQEKRNVFKFRTHMAKFKHNYRGYYEETKCPVCNEHEDTQEQSFSCPKIFTAEEIKESDEYEKIFTENIDKKIVKKISRIVEVREKTLMNENENKK